MDPIMRTSVLIIRVRGVIHNMQLTIDYDCLPLISIRYAILSLSTGFYTLHYSSKGFLIQYEHQFTFSLARIVSWW